MPIHFLKREGTKKRLSAPRKFDDSDLTNSPLNLYLRHTEHPVIMLPSIRGENTGIPKVFKLKTFQKVDREKLILMLPNQPMPDI